MQRLLSAFLLLLSISIFCQEAIAQKGITTFGILLRPGFPNEFFRTGPKDFSDKDIQYSVVQQSGFSFGGSIRKGYSKTLTMEAGIIYTKRNYHLSITDTSFTGKGDYSIIGYEIPLMALVNIQLGQQIWMNAGLGPGVEYYPSDIYTDDDYYRHYSARDHSFNSAINASMGIEWRTRKSGILYLGFIYHRNFSSIYTSVVEYYPTRDFSDRYTSIGRTKLEGDYFGVDLKYFFHEDPEKKQKKKK